MSATIELENQYIAQYYAPLPVVLAKGEGVHVWDENGKKYLDMMCAYSAVSHGHCHPTLVKTLSQQANTLAVVSRAFHTTKLGELMQKACILSGLDKAAPLVTGAEAVELSVKAARKWAYTVKGVPDNQAEIIVCNNNFHGRTTTIISFSTEPGYKAGFGPLTPGFVNIPFNDTDALKKAINKNTAAFLVEPIQGEAGINVPDANYLAECAEICKQQNVLLMCDEIQTGIGRTGKMFAFQHSHIVPDVLMLGKALGGGLLPVSMLLAKDEVMNVFKPGDHGTTFGGNELACAVASEALRIAVDDRYAERSHELGQYLYEKLLTLESPLIKDIRGKGLFIGVEIDPKRATAREVCLELLERGVLSKDTHGTVVRLAPPLIIEKEELDFAVAMLAESLAAVEG